MKNRFLNYLLLFPLLAFFACETDFEEDELDISSTALPMYVDITDGDRSLTGNEGDTLEVVLVLQVALREDVNVSYSLGGTAVDGVDYSIFQNGGGTATITFDENNQDPDQVSIGIALLTDGVTDGDKTLTITLDAATTASGQNLLAGRLPDRSDALSEITLVDVDCPFDATTFPGDFTFVEQTFLGDQDPPVPVSIAAGPNPNQIVINDIDGWNGLFALPGESITLTLNPDFTIAPSAAVTVDGLGNLFTDPIPDPTVQVTGGSYVACEGSESLRINIVYAEAGGGPEIASITQTLTK